MITAALYSLDEFHALRANARAPSPAALSPADAERARVFGILEHPEAEGRHASAMRLARVPGMTPEAAAAILATLPTQPEGQDEDAILASWDEAFQRIHH